MPTSERAVALMTADGDGGLVRAHQREAQGLLRLQVNAPGLLAPWASALDRRIVSVERRVPFEIVAAQADGTRERRAYQLVGVVGPEPGGVRERNHDSRMLAPAAG